ncbi:MAG: TPM domain-containing protein [Spartobacteria bacterium]|nr:TPM domain-containing protein [Spartobacteria bacterium]
MKNRIRGLALLLLLAWGCTTSLLYAISVDDVPNPMTAQGLHVQDSAGVLSPEYIDMIEQRIRMVKQATGSELAVVTVDNLEGDTVDHYANLLFERFGVGRKDEDDGVLVLMSRDDRRIRIEVGYGLEGAINDAKAGRMLSNIAIPRIKEGSPGRGLYELTDALAREIYKENNLSYEDDVPDAWPPENLMETTEPEVMDDSGYTESEGGLAGLISALIAVPIVVLLFHLIYNPFQLMRLRMTRGRAGKVARAKKGLGGLTGVWIFGILATMMTASASGHNVLPTISCVGTMIFMSAWLVKKQKANVAWAEKWTMRCPTCHKPMQLMDEAEDNALLTPEEIAEEHAEGMDYEFWFCDDCHITERIDVKLSKASKCLKCHRRTLTQTSETLVQATRSHTGKIRKTTRCLNAACGYTVVKEIIVPKISSSSSSSSSGSSSSGGSFGGGSSGGGGASGGW